MTREQIEAVVAKLGWTEVPEYMLFLIDDYEVVSHIPSLAEMIDEEWDW